MVLESRAREDLESRYRYLARTASFAAAKSWLEAIVAALESLASLPDRCPLASENDAFSVTIRQLLQGSDRILFTVSRDTRRVHVLHIRHQAREPCAR